MTEIILACLSALFTLIFSIYTITQSRRKEKELEGKQKGLIEAQKQLSEKSELIIQLQKALQEKSEIQIKNIERLNNPIPFEAFINFFSEIEVDKDELEKLSIVSKSTGNLLPTSLETEVSKIEKLKNVQLIIEIVFRKDKQELKIKYSQTPLMFTGYNTDYTHGVGMIVVGSNNVEFYSTKLLTRDIRTNYSSPSIVDFKGSEVTVNIIFGFPKEYRVGEKITNLYLIESQETIPIKLKSISLETNQQTINIENLNKLKNNSFVGKWDN